MTRSLSLLVALVVAAPSLGADVPKKLPMSGLAPSKIFPDLCQVRYRVRTSSPECQAFFDQGLGYFYSYVWMEAVRSFETAVQHDPECAMAWWGLSRAYARHKPGKKHLEALKKAQALLEKASNNEQFLIRARLLEYGLEELPKNTPKDSTNKRVWAASRVLDELLCIYDDEEGYFYRANLASKLDKLGANAEIPYFKGLLAINPVHPGANHELVHFYERFRRPALGWKYAENYIKSSPGIAHAWHMQAHLATRLGRWDKTSDRSARAIEVENAYHKFMGVRPKEDKQYGHHLEILMISLIHDGRFKEARALQQKAQKEGYRHDMPWFRLYHGARDWDTALKHADRVKKSNKSRAAYMAAMVYLKKGDTARAKPEVEVLRQAFARNKKDSRLEFYLLETQGWLLVRSGAVDEGLKMLNKCVEKTIDSFHAHSWGNGSYYMEMWGVAALEAGRLDVAEEAFLEALAHDPGSVRGALGMQVVCEKLDRKDEAAHFAELAKRCWQRAETKDIEAELKDMRSPPNVNNVSQAK